MTGPCHDVSWLTTARTLAFTDIVDLKLGGRESARRFAKRIDARIKQTVTSSDETGWAIAALGGYGRREMAPQSDVDLLFLVGTGNEDIVAPERTSVLQMLWNAGLKVGHATRNLTECAELAASDPTVATAHIDARHIAGDTRLVAELVTQSLAVLQQDASSFIAWLRADAVRRHQRYGDTVYYLEPNLKLGEGGLRDAQTAKWAATVAFGIGYGLTPSGQERIPARVTRDLETGHDFLLKLRITLHQETGFRGDRLTFEAQEKVAKAIGYTCGTTPDTRRLMQETYRHCQRVFRATQRVLDICDAHTTAAHPSTMTVPLSGPFITQASSPA